MDQRRAGLAAVLIGVAMGSTDYLPDTVVAAEASVAASGNRNRLPAGEEWETPPHVQRLPSGAATSPSPSPAVVHEAPPVVEQLPAQWQRCLPHCRSAAGHSSHCWPSADVHGRVLQHADAIGTTAAPLDDVPPMPAEFVPWWESAVVSPQRAGVHPHLIELEQLIVSALWHSPHVQAIRDTLLIQQTAIVDADAEFDVHTFMESKFVRTSDPVGNTLTTGGPPRFRDQHWWYSGGARKKTPLGGTFEVAQRFGYQDNNSTFLDPTQQGTARLSLSYTQPLLNGAGRAYNRSQIVVAELDTRIARDEVASQLTRHLLEVTRTYWDLYLRRAAFQQKKRHYERARQILSRLEDRRQVDALQSQVLSARAAVYTRQAELNRAAASIRNAEGRIRALVNAPEFFQGVELELIATTVPATQQIHVSLRDALVTALYNRPEIDQAFQETRAASIRLNMSAKELLPVLDLVLETYVAGLEGDSEVGRSWVNQFSKGEPGYTAGLLFEVPLHNRRARARHQRRQLELRRVTNQLRAAVDMLMVEVEIAVREVETSYRELPSRYRSMTAIQADVDYLHDRWSLLPGDDRSASFLLEDLLKAQERLAAAELAFVEAQYAYTLSLVQLNQALGTLLAYEDMSFLPVVDTDGGP